MIVVGGDSLSEAATYSLPGGAQLLAMLLAFRLVALYVRQAEAFGALLPEVVAVCLGFALSTRREAADRRPRRAS